MRINKINNKNRVYNLYFENLFKAKKLELETKTKFDYTKILIDTGDKIPNGFTLKNVVILMTCVVKDNDKFYLQIFLGELLLEA